MTTDGAAASLNDHGHDPRHVVTVVVDGARLTIRRADDNGHGPTGVAVDWAVTDLDAFLAEWTAPGSVIHSGPHAVSPGERVCRLVDPFGPLFCIREEIDLVTTASGPSQ